MLLFKTIDEFRKYIPIDANMFFDTVSPFIAEAEDLYVKELLGEAFYDSFVADYTDNTSELGEDTGMNADNLKLLPFVQRSLAYYTAFLSVNHIGASLGEAGIQEQFGEKSRPASRWKVRDLQLHYIQQGDRFADRLLQFLEDNATAVKYSAWFTNEEANTAMQGLIVYSTKIASKYIDINESRRVFLRLKKRIKQIEQAEVRRMLCNEQYEELVTQIQTGTLTAVNEALANQLAPYVSKKALWLTVPALRVAITDEGISVLSSNDGVVQKMAASKEDVKALMCNLKEGEFGFEADKRTVDQFIIDNISDYPLIEASPCWAAKETGTPRYRIKNDPLNKHFSV